MCADGSVPNPDAAFIGTTCQAMDEQLKAVLDTDKNCVVTRQAAINQCGCPYDKSLPTCNICGRDGAVPTNLTATIGDGLTCKDFVDAPALNGVQTCKTLVRSGLGKACNCQDGKVPPQKDSPMAPQLAPVAAPTKQKSPVKTEQGSSVDGSEVSPVASPMTSEEAQVEAPVRAPTNRDAEDSTPIEPASDAPNPEDKSVPATSSIDEGDEGAVASSDSAAAIPTCFSLLLAFVYALTHQG